MAGADILYFVTSNDSVNPFAFGPTAFVITSDVTIAATHSRQA